MGWIEKPWVVRKFYKAKGNKNFIKAWVEKLFYKAQGSKKFL
jgi:hypothetical protein